MTKAQRAARLKELDEYLYVVHKDMDFLYAKGDKFTQAEEERLEECYLHSNEIEFAKDVLSNR